MSELKQSVLTKLIKYIKETACNEDILKRNLFAASKILEREFLYDGGKEREINDGINDIFKEQKPVALILGAGVSMGDPFNVPNWSGLLRRAIVGHYYIDYDINEVIGGEKGFENIMNDLESGSDFFGGFDLYELAQYIENILKERKRNSGEIEQNVDTEMRRIVKGALYYGVNKKPETTGSFLSCICKTVQSRKIRRILTYNYDNAFEYTYRKEIENVMPCPLDYLPRPPIAEPIFIDKQLPYANENKKVEIYHVHGFINGFEIDSPSDLWGEALKEQDATIEKYANSMDAKKLVLSESSYDEIEQSGYKWRNTVQVDTFVRYNCIFLGFSATDKNFKRIVKQMDWYDKSEEEKGKQPVRHYIFMTIDDYLQNCFGFTADQLDIYFEMREKHEKILHGELVDWLKSKIKCKDDRYDKFLKAIDLMKEEKVNDILAKLEDPKWIVVRSKFLYYVLRSRRKYFKNLHIYPIWTTIANAKNDFEKLISKK